MNIKLKIFALLILTLVACKKNDFTSLEGKLDRISDQLEVDPIDKLLDLIKESNSPKKFKEEFSENRISFTLDFANEDAQVIHISSDHMKLPFMVLCKVEKKTTPLSKKQSVLPELDFAVRSIAKLPHSFFRIVGRPTLIPRQDGDFDWDLNLDIDLNQCGRSSENSILRLSDVNGNVESGDRIEVHIKPEKLIESLTEIYNSNENFHKILDEKAFEEYLRYFCCGGVVCETKVIIPQTP